VRDKIIQKMSTIKGSTVKVWRTMFDVDELLYILNNIFYKNLDLSFLEVKYAFINNIMDKPVCPVCGGDVEFKYGGFKKYCSSKCRKSKIGKDLVFNKIKKTNLEKYGVENVAQSDEVKSKVKKTNLEKYGVESHLQSDDVKLKIKKTNLKKYGVENVAQSDEVKSKIKKTNLEKYGVENVAQSDEIKSKIKKTNLEKYGVEYYSQTDEYLEKVKETNLEKYGKDWILQSDEIKSKIKKTNLEKYGVEYYSQTDEYLEKVKETNLEKYGVEYYSQSNVAIADEIKRNRESYYSTFILLLKQKQIQPLFTKDEYIQHDYDSSVKKYKCLKCDKTFENVNLKAQRIFCPHHKYKSQAEHDIKQWLLSENDELDILSNKYFYGENNERYELDLYLPELNLGIEHHGLYWHSEAHKDNNYHKDKYNFFKEKGIEVIQIFENEWVNAQEIVKSIIRIKMGVVKRKVYGRSCDIREVLNDEYTQFCELNHLQGYGIAKVRLGLYYNNTLLMVMSFSKPRFNKKYKWENIRTCTLLNVIVLGGFSKLIKYFINNYEGDIISYVDVRYFNGNGYIKNGFELIGHTRPNFYYFKNGVLSSRLTYQKHKLKYIFNNFDENKTAHENMLLNKYLRIYDAGNLIMTMEN